MNFRIGHGYDIHRLVEGRALYLGGVQIPHEKGLTGHSDADVALHAACDAILGAAGILIVGLLAGCGLTKGSPGTVDSVAWLNSGALSFGGPVPAPGQLGSTAATSPQKGGSTEDASNYSYGFAPTSEGSRSLVLDTRHNRAVLMQAGKELASADLLDTSGLAAGSYTVAHKQRNPLWHAPDYYFQSRGLATPAEGDKQRYLRGAFGDFALFVSPTEAIHSGPFALSELTGARLDEQAFAKIFYLVEVGDTIQVQ